MKHLKTLITLFLLVIGTGMSRAAFKNVILDFTKSWATAIHPGGAASSLYVTDITDGVPTLSDTETEGYMAHIFGYYKDATYGLYYNAKVKVPVEAGKYKIDLGMSDYGGDIAITDGTKVWNINSMGGKYAYDPANMASDIVTVESDCVLEIYASTNGANVYFPYIAVSKVEEIEFKDFSINFIKPWAAENISSGGPASSYYVTAVTDGVPTLTTSAPANYIAYFLGYYKNSTYGLYYNPIIKVPVKAGKYEISLGMSDYGGDVTVTDGTNVLTINNTGDKFAVNADNVATGFITVESDCVLEIYPSENPTGVYFPYIGVKKVAEATHTHSFSGTWTQTATHHYHACTAEGCDIDYSAVPSDLADYVKYGVHNYGSIITLAAYYTCSVCGFENEARKADAEAVGAVSSLIDAIGEVEFSTSCKAKIDAARKAYDKLSEGRRDLVLNYDELTAAEAMYKAITPIDVAERTAVWNWKDATLDDQIAKETQITGSIGEIHSDVAGMTLEADATATGSNYFKAQMAGSVCYATLSVGSTIKVPIRRPGDKVFITCPVGQNSYTIGNVAGKDVDPKKGYTATQEDAANGYALITATKTNHFYEIKVTQKWFNAVLPKITLNSEGWASFTSLLRGYVVACPLGAKAYVATAVDDETVTLKEVTHFTYGEGVFINGDRDSEVFANVVEAESTYPKDNNLTVGCPNDVMLYAESNAYIVATNNDNDESGFYHVKTAINVPAGKAYLYAPNTKAKSLKITFADGEEATGIESVIAGAKAETPTVFYNLSGQKVDKNYKGIVIGNDGKKYMK